MLLHSHLSMLGSGMVRPALFPFSVGGVTHVEQSGTVGQITVRKMVWTASVVVSPAKQNVLGRSLTSRCGSRPRLSPRRGLVEASTASLESSSVVLPSSVEVVVLVADSASFFP